LSIDENIRTFLELGLQLNTTSIRAVEISLRTSYNCDSFKRMREVPRPAEVVSRPEKTDRSFLPEAEARAELMERASKIVNDIHDKGFDLVVFLDKTARPLSWIVRKLWRAYYPDEALPAIKFLNIGSPEPGKGISEHLPVPTPVGLSEMARLATEGWVSTDSLRRDIKKNAAEGRQDVADLERQLMLYLDGDDEFADKVSIPEAFDAEARHIAVIDDFVFSGRALTYAMSLMTTRNEEAMVEGIAFFTSGGGLDREKIPWLHEKQITGVRDRHSSSDRAFAHPTAKRKSKQSKAFRAEINQMVSEFLDARMSRVDVAAA
jgi:hypothetical protein